MTSSLTRCVSALPTFLWSLVTVTFLVHAIAWVYFPQEILENLKTNVEMTSEGKTWIEGQYFVRLQGANALFGFAATMSLASWNLSKRISLLLTTLALHLGFVAILVLHTLSDTNPWNDTFKFMFMVFGGVGTGLTLLQVLAILGNCLCTPLKATITNTSSSLTGVTISTSRGGGAVSAERAKAMAHR